jgi:hypothetical protein
MADAPDPKLQENFLLDLKKAKEVAGNAKDEMESAANMMFQFYADLLSVEAKYTWNKIITEQTAFNPYVDLQGVSQKGPRGPSHKSFDDCMLLHLLTMFPVNTAEQDRYYITNVLKKPQRVSVHQFVHRVEQQPNASLCSCHTFTTAQVSMPRLLRQTFHSPRLTWQVTSSGCVHFIGRTSTTSTRKI